MYARSCNIAGRCSSQLWGWEGVLFKILSHLYVILQFQLECIFRGAFGWQALGCKIFTFCEMGSSIWLQGARYNALFAIFFIFIVLFFFLFFSFLYIYLNFPCFCFYQNSRDTQTLILQHCSVWLIYTCAPIQTFFCFVYISTKNERIILFLMF